MNNKQAALEEILLEATASSSTSASSVGDAEIDALLASILAEKAEKKSQGLTGTDAPYPGREEPTKVFQKRTKRLTSPKKPVFPTPPRQQPPPLEAMFPEASPPKPPVQEPTARQEQPPPQPKASAPPKKQADPENPPKPQPEKAQPLETGKIVIDVDGIRAQQPAPEPLPAQELPPEEPKRIRPAEKVREKSPIAEYAEAEFSCAPPFAAAGKKMTSGKKMLENPSACARLLRSYAAKSLGLGLLTAALAACLLGASVFLQLQRLEHPGEALNRMLLIATAVLGAVACGLSFPIIGGGLLSLVKLEPNRESLPAVSALFCFLQALGQALFPKGLVNINVQFYLPIGVMLLSGAWFSRYLTYQTASLNGKFVFSDYNKFIPQAVSDDSRLALELTKGLVEGYGLPVINRRTELLGDFIPVSFGTDSSDTMGRNLAITAVVLGGAAGLFTFLFTDHKNMAVTVMTAVFLVCSPLTNLFFTVYPFRRSAKLLNRVGGLAAGERCVKDCAEVNAAVVDARDLLPPSSVTLTGIKTFRGMRIDEAILDAASVLIQSGSILSSVFLRIIAEKTKLLSPIDSVTYEDGMGLSAWIKNKRVLIGSRDLLAAHGLRVPSADYERRFTEEGSDLIYLASAGELRAVFVITLQPAQDADTAIQMLLENDILLTVHTVDAIVTREKLAKLYLCDETCFKILPARLQEKYKNRKELVKVKPASLANNGSFAAMAASLATARRIKVMSALGNVIQIVSILLGVGVVLMLALLDAMVQFSAPVLCGYMILWLLVTLLVQRMVRV